MREREMWTDEKEANDQGEDISFFHRKTSVNNAQYPKAISPF